MATSATYRLNPSDRRVRFLGLTLVVLLTTIGLLWNPKPVLASVPQCTNQGYHLFENGSPFNGDWADICSPTLIPVSASRSNYPVNPGAAYLINGCAAGIGSHSTWNDCVSGVQIDNLASGYKFQLFRDINYVALIFCVDANGDHTYSLNSATNDRASSSRIVTGDC